MRGYPRNPNALTKVDILNLLSMPEYAENTAKDLAKLAEFDDRKITVDTGSAEQPKVQLIDNPMPTWKIIGFRNKEEMLTIAKIELKPVEEPVEDKG